MSDRLSLAFHGAARTVTGSKFLLRAGGERILIDAGLFQGLKELRLLNWDEPRFEPRSIDHVLLTHTHIDHIGYLPRLVKLGLRAPVHCTLAARQLAELMLMDSAKIQEEDARFSNKKGFSRHKPALPLYTSKDARRALKMIRKQRYQRWVPLDRSGRLRAMFRNAGHILGSSFIEIRVPSRGRELRIVFSGDVGRFDIPLHVDPRPLVDCDVLIIESTYGDREHTTTSVLEQIREPFRRTLSEGGTVLIPAFAVGRSQQITWILRLLMREEKLPEVPIHIDSPMAINATRIYSRFLDKRNLDPEVYEDGRLRLFPDNVTFHRSVQESKRLNDMRGPRIIISASGMLTGGRVLHHLQRLGPDRRNLIMLVGYQAEGTRARDLLEGRDEIKMHGRFVPVRATVISVQGLSGHADRSELLRWVGSASRRPKTAFVVHGEPDSADSFARELRERFAISAIIPNLGDEFDLVELLARRGAAKRE
ncbi:MAG: MBL fold metallo-hydrolase [Acidobacteriota bacterium]|nr:MAG: MBL fold metallo-hydrolase [Acidobacteriota bacterium]